MGKILLYFSVATASFAIINDFINDIFVSAFITFFILVLVFIGFKTESYIKVNGNQLLNRIIYYITKNNKKYNILNKHITYTYLGNNKYSFEKKYEILPKSNDVDRINDRFGWSAPSNGAIISPTENKHSINSKWVQEIWTCFSVYFRETAKRNRPYNVGVVITNLVDTTHSAVPFLSNTIERKTKCTTLEVVFSAGQHPSTAKFEVFSPESETVPNCSDVLEYDNDIGGFKKTVLYPRKGWKYVISWD